MIRVGTVAGGEELPAARVLAATLARHHAGVVLEVLVLGEAVTQVREHEPFTSVRRRDLLASHPGEPSADPVVARAMLALHLLAGAVDEPVVLLPADAQVLAPLNALVAPLTQGAAAVVVPRLLHGALPDDGRHPDAAALVWAGTVDDATIALTPGEEGVRVANWWADLATEGAQRPLDAARGGLAGVVACTDQGIGASAWNLHERPLSGAPGSLRAGGAPLALLRFEGFRPDRPWWLSEHATRVLVLDDPILTDLCADRATAMQDAGWPTTRPGQEPAPAALNLRLDERTRRLHAEAVEAGEDPGDLFEAAGAERLMEWLREPAPRGAAVGLNRYTYDAWAERGDLQQAYPDLDGEDGVHFVGWLWVHGREEMGLEERLLPDPPAWLTDVDVSLPSVRVTGYLRGHLGLGAAARGYVRALEATGVPVATRTIELEDRSADTPWVERPAHHPPQVELVCVNAEQLPEVLEGDPGSDGRYVIGQWAWEIDAIPHWWGPSYELADEIWVYSRFVAENIARDSPKPVVVVPLPVTPPDPAGSTVRGTLPEGFLFVFAFDFLSTLQRKNPLGLVRAFTQAFAPGEGPTLVLKTINADLRPVEREQLRHAAGGRGDVVLVDGAWSAGEVAALFHRADCYVSLHRSEGFGLTPAEAMALGKPVVATGFGGVMDFMTPHNSYLVDWTPVGVGGEAEHYLSEGTWAEPSIEHAASLLRAVYDDPEEAARRGARARADIQAVLSPEAVGAIARRRLERVATRLAPPADPERTEEPVPALDRVEERLHFDLTGEGGPGGPRSLVRRATLRALRPYAVHERLLDEELARALRVVRLELSAERAARGRDRERIARLEALLRNGR